MIGYDGIPINEDILLDLQFSEGAGLIVRDQAKPHHEDVDQNDPGGGSFTWARALTEHGRGFGRGFDWGFDAKIGIGCLDFAAVGGGPGDGVYLNFPAVDCADLNFTSGDYSVGGWINWDSTGAFSEIIIGRYGTDLDGWDLYLAISGGRNTLSQRHHHSSVGGDTNTQCFSEDWTPGTWAFFGVSRIGGNLYPLHYRNGIALTVSYEATGMFDPDTCNREMVIGVRAISKDSNWYRGSMQGLRVWGRALSSVDWLTIFEQEKDYFGL